MCYSAMVYAEYKKYVREHGALMDVNAYVKLFWWQQGRDPVRRPRAPRAMERELLRDGRPDLAEAIRQWDAQEIAQLEQEIFKQRKRVADGERALQSKPTKKAQEDVRIGAAKVEQAMRRLGALKRSDSQPDDSRIYPGYYCPVLVWEDGRRVVKPMRYQCRMPGWTEVVERKFPGTYNARRDKLETSWGKLFGYSHGVMLATAFYEHVDQNGQDVILEFKPATGQDMLAACLWSRCVDAQGNELLSFAAITDDPPAEVAAAGHDRCIIPIKPENVDAWLNPDPANLAQQYAILDDRERPYYEHRMAA